MIERERTIMRSIPDAGSGAEFRALDTQYPVPERNCPECHRTMGVVALWMDPSSRGEVAPVWELGCPTGHGGVAVVAEPA